MVACALASCAANAGSTLDAPLGCALTADEIVRTCGVSPRTVPTCSPDGAGWCCAYGEPSCNSAGMGGFETDPCRCSAHVVSDLPPAGWGMRTDEHGCPTLAFRPTTACCLCVRADAGSPGDAEDAGSPEDARDAESPADAGEAGPPDDSGVDAP